MVAGPLWAFLKTAAANIPWTKVAQNTPMLVDMLGKAKARINSQEASQKGFDDQLKHLHDENARLSAALLQTSGKLQLLTARVATLTKISIVSLFLAISAVVLWMLK